MHENKLHWFYLICLVHTCNANRIFRLAAASIHLILYCIHTQLIKGKGSGFVRANPILEGCVESLGRVLRELNAADDGWWKDSRRGKNKEKSKVKSKAKKGTRGATKDEVKGARLRKGGGKKAAADDGDGWDSKLGRQSAVTFDMSHARTSRGGSDGDDDDCDEEDDDEPIDFNPRESDGSDDDGGDDDGGGRKPRAELMAGTDGDADDDDDDDDDDISITITMLPSPPRPTTSSWPVRPAASGWTGRSGPTSGPPSWAGWACRPPAAVAGAASMTIILPPQIPPPPPPLLRLVRPVDDWTPPSSWGRRIRF